MIQILTRKFLRHVILSKFYTTIAILNIRINMHSLKQIVSYNLPELSHIICYTHLGNAYSSSRAKYQVVFRILRAQSNQTDVN